MNSEEWKPSGHNDYTGTGLFSKHVQDCLDIAWAAGLFEGEGCIYAHPIYRGYHARISLGMTDLDSVERFRDILCRVLKIDGKIREKPVLGHKTLHMYIINKYKYVEIIVSAFWPWLGARRKAKSIETLTMSRTDNIAHADKTHCPKGHPLSGDNLVRSTLPWRKCRICKAAHDAEYYLKRKIKLGCEEK